MRVIALLLASIASQCWAGDTSDDPLGRTPFTVRAIESAHAALLAFRRDQPTAKSVNFSVLLRESAANLEVEFVPKPSPIKTGCEGKTCYVTMDAGGATIYGRDVVYVVSKHSRQVISRIYPK